MELSTEKFYFPKFVASPCSNMEQNGHHMFEGVPALYPECMNTKYCRLCTQPPMHTCALYYTIITLQCGGGKAAVRLKITAGRHRGWRQRGVKR